MAQEVDGETVADALDSLFRGSPGLRGHVVAEDGRIRTHVSVFVDGVQADLDTELGDGSEIRILQAVSGGVALRPAPRGVDIRLT